MLKRVDKFDETTTKLDLVSKIAMEISPAMILACEAKEKADSIASYFAYYSAPNDLETTMGPDDWEGVRNLSIDISMAVASASRWIAQSTTNLEKAEQIHIIERLMKILAKISENGDGLENEMKLSDL
jgi:hypothetical protein